MSFRGEGELPSSRMAGIELGRMARADQDAARRAKELITAGKLPFGKGVASVPAHLRGVCTSKTPRGLVSLVLRRRLDNLQKEGGVSRVDGDVAARAGPVLPHAMLGTQPTSRAS